jgi:hypothetical protein
MAGVAFDQVPLDVMDFDQSAYFRFLAATTSGSLRERFVSLEENS